MITLDEQIQTLREEILKQENTAQSLDTIQHAFKIFLNSTYGQMGTQHFPIADLDAAEAITLSGQHIIKHSAEFVESLVNNGDDAFKAIAGGDTDSIYVDVEHIVRSLYDGQIPEWTDEVVQNICSFIDREIVPKINDNCFKLAQDYFKSNERVIEFKREAFITEAVFLKKKHYQYHKRDDEGVPCDKFVEKGISIKKNELPAFIKKWLETITRSALVVGWDNAQFQNEISKYWKLYKSLPVSDIAFNKGYRTPKATIGFLQMEKGAGATAKAVTFYNQVIEKYGLIQKYDNLLVGDLARYVYITENNELGCSVMAFNEKWPVEFDELFEIDKEKMFDKTVLMPLANFIEIYGWSNFCVANQIQGSLDDF